KPNYAEAHYHLGLALEENEKWHLDEAIKELRIPGLALDTAIKEYREAIRIKPDYAEAHHHLGLALDKKGLLDEAIKEYREAIRITPKDGWKLKLEDALKTKGTSK